MNKFVTYLTIFLFTAITYAAEPAPVIKNGIKPKGIAKTLELKEEVRITAETGEEDHYLWVGPTVTVAANSKGHMLVGDPKSARIVEFDPQGEYVKTYGSRGAGPGEFQNMTSFQILKDDRAVAFEALGPVSHVSWFDKDMAFVTRDTNQSFTHIETAALFSPDGTRRISQIVNYNAETMIMGISTALMDAEKKTLKEIGHVDSPAFNPARVNDKEFWVDFLAAQFKLGANGETGIMAFDDDGNLYVAPRLKHYRIEKYDKNLNHVLTIERKYDPIAISEAEVKALTTPIYETILAQLPAGGEQLINQDMVRRALVKAEYPKFKMPIFGMKALEDGTLLVIHDINVLDNHETFDIFDKAGAYLGSYKHSSQGLTRMVFRNGKAYTVENVDDENEMVRYDVKLVPAK
ncbi:hypothetical protein SCOR_09400 [Sulfidibacter corallicola]|uniref:6-bladed beta-propeller protein n=1 Tax=Sulfidibacter corallicola TaxID=2818388 RepID=A0A8A4TNM4_SULCO|nr:6-bladed beta-propeller [Sulfidibacter corallicola]QTD51027.1 hypothetical protein J3U87_01040 [Sulfidibacter corallicola]